MLYQPIVKLLNCNWKYSFDAILTDMSLKKYHSLEWQKNMKGAN